jgi:hypothetical protein
VVFVVLLNELSLKTNEKLFMFEIDENTRYSLRILGRVSFILVSVALILAIIGYLKRDEDDYRGENPQIAVFDAEKLYKSVDRLNGELMNSKITVQGVADSVYTDEKKTVLLFEQDNEKSILTCSFQKTGLSSSIEHGEKLVKIEGLSRGTLGSSIIMERCKIKK